MLQFSIFARMKGVFLELILQPNSDVLNLQPQQLNCCHLLIGSSDLHDVTFSALAPPTGARQNKTKKYAGKMLKK